MIDEINTINAINAAIDAGLVRAGAQQNARNYLGGSRLGEPCGRKLRFEWDDTQANIKTPGTVPPPFNGKAYRRFEMGHAHEDVTAKWFKQAGFDLRTHNEDGSQYAFGEPESPIAGHIDGVIVGGPVPLPYPLLWEHKIMNVSNFKKVVSEGVERSKPTYYGQLQVYMRWTDLLNALFTALNTDTSELHYEIVPYRADVATRLIERGKEIIAAPDAMNVPRITTDPADFQCKWCDHKAKCWKALTPAVAPAVATTGKPVWAR